MTSGAEHRRAEHIAILDAILAGDASKAEKLMREHVRRGREAGPADPRALLD